MANTFITPVKVANEALMLLKNQTLMGRKVHRQYGGEFANPKTGSPLQVRKPNRYTVTEGATLSIQDSTEQYTTIPQPSQKHVAMAATSKEMTMEIEDYSERHIVPAVAQLSNHIDMALTGLYNQVPLSVGIRELIPTLLLSSTMLPPACPLWASRTTVSGIWC